MILGVQRRTADLIVAEIGVDIAVFPTAKQLASRIGSCPSNNQSAGKRRPGSTRHGSKWLDWALEEAQSPRSDPRAPTSRPNMRGCGHAVGTRGR